MLFKQWQIRIITLFICYILPCTLLVGQALFHCNGYVMLMIDVNVGLLIYLFYRCNSWELSCLFLRNVYLAAYLAVTIWKTFTATYSSVLTAANYYALILNIVLLLILFRIFYKVRKALKKPETLYKLQFPYKDGTFLVSDAGDGACSSLVNYHYKSVVHSSRSLQNSMRYAVDIVKMNRFGRTAKTLLRKQNKDYESFDEKIYCPLAGEVVEAVDGIPDNTPFPGIQNMNYSVGNHVVIRQQNYYLILGHFKNGSVRVKKGDKVSAGDLLGCSGCSGLSPRPEIHIQLVKSSTDSFWQGAGVPFLFNDTIYPIKNLTIKI